MNLLAKRSLAMTAAVVLVVGAIAVVKIRSVRAIQARMAMMKAPPSSVSTTTAALADWQHRFHAVGSLVAVQGVVVSNQIEGAVTKVSFESGQRVESGDLLVQQDISSDTAQLRGLEAQAELARLTLERAKELRAKETNSQADLDSAEAQYKAAVAAADNERAIIAKKTIRAPFAGILGIRQVNVGQFLPAGGSIVSLEALDPIYANFSLPQQDMGALRAGQTVRMTVDAYPGSVFEGKINALNSTVDDASRNILVQATFANADGRLVPGMYASVDVILPGADRYVTLPESAIVYNPYGNAVYVVEKAGDQALVARQHFVTLGETRGDQVAIEKGVKAGDVVVTAGQLKLHNGSPIVVNNSVLPPSDPAPTPPNT